MVCPGDVGEPIRAKIEDANSPTAAFRRLHKNMRAAITTMLTPQAAMLATLPMEPSEPRCGIPHLGFTPTGASDEGIERPVRVEFDSR